MPKPESQCSQLVKRTGDITTDINALGEACGNKFGLAAVADPYSRTLSADQGWQRQFQMELPAGCYRLFAAGDSGIQDLYTGIKDATGKVIAEDSSRVRCRCSIRTDRSASQRTKVDLFARVGKGSGRYAMWGWKKK